LGGLFLVLLERNGRWMRFSKEGLLWLFFFLLFFQWGLDDRRSGSFLRSRKRARLHPSELTGGFLDWPVEEPEESAEQDDMNQADDDKRPAEAGFLHTHRRLLLGSLSLGPSHHTDFRNAGLMKQVHDAHEILDREVFVGPHDDSKIRLLPLE